MAIPFSAFFLNITLAASNKDEKQQESEIIHFSMFSTKEFPAKIDTNVSL